MIKKDAFQNLKCRRIYLFFLDEETGEITDITSRDDVIQVVRCKDCKHMIEHKGYGYLGESAYTCESNMGGWILPDSYCSMAERKDDETD